MRNPIIWPLALLAVSVSGYIFLISRPAPPATVAAVPSPAAPNLVANDKCMTRFYELTVGEKKACIAAFDDGRCTTDRDSLRPIEAQWCARGLGRNANALKARCAAIQVRIDAEGQPGWDGLSAGLRADIEALGGKCTLRGDGRQF